MPIIALTGGLASLIPTSFNLGTSIQNSLNNTFADYVVLPGGTLISNSIGMYPMLNQQVAANAIIAQPLTISIKMIVPVKPPVTAAGTPSLPFVGRLTVPLTGGYATKLATMTAIVTTLTQHNNLGGLYSILTPAYPYTNLIMTSMRDVSSKGPTQTQIEYQFDFVKPLVTVQQAQNSLNGLMSKLTNGTAISGTPTWTPAGLPLGNPTSLLTSSLVPSPFTQ